MTNDQSPKSQFQTGNRVRIHCPGSVLHGLAGKVVPVDTRHDPPNSAPGARVLIDGDLYPVWFPEHELRAE